MLYTLTLFDLQTHFDLPVADDKRNKRPWSEEGQYRSTAIGQKLNLPTAPPPGGHVFDQSTWIERI